MRFMRLAAAAALCTSLGSAASASAVYNRRITGVVVQGGNVYVYFDGAVNDGTCTWKNRYMFDGSTAAGQTMAATVLTAYSLNKLTDIQGTATCGDTEGLSLINVHN